MRGLGSGIPIVRRSRHWFSILEMERTGQDRTGDNECEFVSCDVSEGRTIREDNINLLESRWWGKKGISHLIYLF